MKFSHMAAKHLSEAVASYEHDPLAWRKVLFEQPAIRQFTENFIQDAKQRLVMVPNPHREKFLNDVMEEYTDGLTSFIVDLQREIEFWVLEEIDPDAGNRPNHEKA